MKIVKHKTLWLFCSALFVSGTLFAQEKLLTDIDFDGIKDSVYVDKEKSVIVCRLSSQKFKIIKSKPIEILNDQSGVNETHNGFQFSNHWMRAGYNNQFRFDKKTKRIQLIGMDRYEFGNAANDGSGESSVNLLTGDYIGDWNYYDHFYNNEEGQLVKIPTIKTKMPFKKIYLEGFDDGDYFEFGLLCAHLFEQHKQKEVKRRKKQIR